MANPWAIHKRAGHSHMTEFAGEAPAPAPAEAPAAPPAVITEDEAPRENSCLSLCTGDADNLVGDSPWTVDDGAPTTGFFTNAHGLRIA